MKSGIGKMKAPKWYTRKEVKAWFVLRGINHSPKEIIMFTEALQKAFEKGWEKRGRQSDILIERGIDESALFSSKGSRCG